MARKTRTLSFRFVIRDSTDGLVAECLDAGAIGIGATKAEAISDMIKALEVLYAEHGKAMKVPALKKDEAVFHCLEQGKPLPATDKSVVAWGRAELVALKRAKEAFDVSQLLVAA